MMQKGIRDGLFSKSWLSVVQKSRKKNGLHGYKKKRVWAEYGRYIKSNASLVIFIHSELAAVVARPNRAGDEVAVKPPLTLLVEYMSTGSPVRERQRLGLSAVRVWWNQMKSACWKSATAFLSVLFFFFSFNHSSGGAASPPHRSPTKRHRKVSAQMRVPGSGRKVIFPHLFRVFNLCNVSAEEMEIEFMSVGEG